MRIDAATDTGQRLQHAAIGLFHEQGFGATTVDAIVAQVGVTQRTFFRYFADKTEVVFGDDAELLGVLTDVVDGAPAGEPAVSTTRRALQALATRLAPQREALRVRDEVIRTEPDLRERELLKLDRWRRELEQHLQRRGVPRADAVLVTALGFACWSAAWEPWVTSSGGARLGTRIDRAYGALTTLLCDAR